ncbi:MAG: DNA alkylation repair protein [Gemmatimonadaceae bacterium]
MRHSGILSDDERDQRNTDGKAAQKRLAARASLSVARHSQRFFKTGPGEYAEGDRFRGIRVPVLRAIARACAEMPLGDTRRLQRSP